MNTKINAAARLSAAKPKKNTDPATEKAEQRKHSILYAVERIENFCADIRKAIARGDEHFVFNNFHNIRNTASSAADEVK